MWRFIFERSSLQGDRRFPQHTTIVRCTYQPGLYQQIFDSASISALKSLVVFATTAYLSVGLAWSRQPVAYAQRATTHVSYDLTKHASFLSFL